MATVVFDFDGTISDAFSSLLIFKHLRFHQIAKACWFLFWEKLTGRGDYQRRLVETLQGMEKEKIIEIGRNIPEIEETVELLFKLRQKNHKIYIISYGLKPIIDAFLEKKHLEVEEVIAIDLKFEDGRVAGPAEDSMSQLLISDPDGAKHKIIRLKKIKPDLSVGDSEKRDKHSDEYIAIQDLRGRYFRINQVMRSLAR